MPYSNIEQMPIIINEIKRHNPNSILDVGCGIGLYGILIRVFLELYDDAEGFLDRLLTRNWQIRVDAVEGYYPYLKFIPAWVYDHIWNANVFEIFPHIKDKEYDMAIAIAILEHLDREAGHVFLEQLKRIARVVIVSVPAFWGPQVVPANPLENHRSHWTKEDFIQHDFTSFLPSPRSTIAIYNTEHREPSKVTSFKEFFNKLRKAFKKSF